MQDKNKKRYSKLTDEELVIKYQNGDQLALEYLFIKYNKHIHKIASKYYGKTNLCNDDILSEAYIGFIEGVKKFDPSYNGYFMYFTRTWIKVKIFVALDNASRLVRIPVNRLKEHRKIKKAIVQLNGAVSVQNISEHTNIPEDKIREYLDSSTYTTDIEKIINSPSDAHKKLFSEFNDEDLKHDLSRILNNFSMLEVFILIHTFGLFGNDVIDKQVLSERLDISVERIRQIKDKVIRKLRHASYASILKQYLD